MKSEFTLAFNEITERFGLGHETVMEALQAAMVSAYRRSVNASSAQEIEARIDPESGDVLIYAEKEIVDDVENPMTEVSLEEARKVQEDIELGEMILVESTPADFGRVAAQTAKQVILQRLREAERDAQYDEFVEREGDMVHGTVHSITPQAVTVGLGRAEALLPRNQQIPGERFHVRDRIRVYVLEVRKSSRGPVIVVSRTHPNMLRRLLEMEVPEINQGLVEIKGIAREAGKRAKVAVAATREGVDPVGACVGLRGVRIQSIVRDLNDEKIDVIEWNPDPATFIAKALSPARVSGVFLEEDLNRGKTAIVIVPEDQLSLAIGRAGVNARLAARLTGWRIDIKSLIEAASESLQLLAEEEEFSGLAGSEEEAVPQVEAVLTKKQETRPVTPEEYQLLTAFVDRVQGEVMARKDAERRALQEELEAIRSEIPESAYEVPLADLDLATRAQTILEEAEYSSAGQVMEQLAIDKDEILGLPGIGPKYMKDINEKVHAYPYPEPEPIEVIIEEVEPAEGVPEAEGVGEPEAAEAEPVPEPAELAAEAIVEEAEAAAEVALEDAEAEVEEVLEEELTEEELETAEEKQLPPDAVKAIEEAFKEAAEVVEEVDLEEELLEEDEEEEDFEETEAERRERKARKRILEYDPEIGETIVRRKRKKSRQEEWDEYDLEQFDDIDFSDL